MGASCGSLESNSGNATAISVNSGAGPKCCSSCFKASDGEALTAGSPAPEPAAASTASTGEGLSESDATVLVQPVVQQAPVVQPKPTVAKRSAALTSAINKIKKASLGAASEIKDFRKFMKPLYSTPGEAYTDLVGSSPVLDRATFMAKLEEMQYPGNRIRLFNGLREGETISREAFKQRMVAVAQTQKLLKSKKLDFGSVVAAAVEVMKAEQAEAAAKGATGKGADAAAAASGADDGHLAENGEQEDVSRNDSKQSNGKAGRGSRGNRRNRSSKEDGPIRRLSSESASGCKSKPPLGPDGRKGPKKLSRSASMV